MANDLGDEEPEVEIVCPECGYHLACSAARLRQNTPVVCPNCGKEIGERQESDNNGA
jgi:predicted RNA-binding Zn-ribbon protein involved in translation (DUF1610 family)